MRKIKIELDSGLIITVRPPTVRQFYEERAEIKTRDDCYRFIAAVLSRNDEGITFTSEQVLDEFTTDDYNYFWREYIEWVVDEHETNPN